MPANEDVSLGPASKQRMVLILSVKCMASKQIFMYKK